MNNLEQFLFDNDYLKRGAEEYVITSSAKWNKMMKDLFKAYPNQILTEKMIMNYVADLS